MATTTNLPFLLLLALLLLSSPSSSALSPPRRTTLVLPVSKDPSTNQYLTRIEGGTPSAVFSLVLDLGASYPWVNACEKGHTSATLSYISCKSRDCKAALSKACTVPQNICGASASNPYTKTSTPGDLAQDHVTIPTVDGSNSGKPVFVPNVTFACAPKSLLKGLAAGTAGMVGLGRTGVALQSRFSSALRFPNKFALCLPSDRKDGVAFFGDGPYVFKNKQVFSSSSFVYTPLLTNPVSTALVSFVGDPSVEYFINVKAVKVNGKTLPVKSSLLSISSKGKGGTKLSTVNPYTVLESSIYKAVVDAFAKESQMRRVKAEAPFGACFSSWGPGVPDIELVMDGCSWIWRGANYVVVKPNEVLCLALLDGGVNAETSIVVGGFQMQDNLLMFDLVKKRFGVAGSFRASPSETRCSDFNFQKVP